MKFIFNITLAFFSAISIFGPLTACDKEPEVIIETKIDTLIVIDTVTLIDTFFQNLPDTATTFILLRHAETTGSGSNPNLSVDGQARATRLSQMLDKVNLNAVYSSDYKRTTQTAQPTATAKGLSIITYDPTDPGNIASQALHSYPLGTVLIVGHSNTIPELLNLLVGSNMFPDIPESEYDNLLIVHVSALGDATVTHLKY
jgi:broad specificity phosphatase PhoE